MATKKKSVPVVFKHYKIPEIVKGTFKAKCKHCTTTISESTIIIMRMLNTQWVLVDQCNCNSNTFQSICICNSNTNLLTVFVFVFDCLRVFVFVFKYYPLYFDPISAPG